MIQREEVEKVAALARLKLSEEETQNYAQQLSAILDYFSQLKDIQTEGVEPMVTPTEMAQYLRADAVQPGFGAEVALANAPERSGNLFKVPPVV